MLLQLSDPIAAVIRLHRWHIKSVMNHTNLQIAQVTLITCKTAAEMHV